MKLERLRPGQRSALNTVLGRIAVGESYTAILLPTRYGKSDVIRLAALLSQRDGTSAGSIALSPGHLLTRQLVRGDKVDEMGERYGLSARRMRVMSSATEWQPFSNGEALLSATMQLATRNIDAFAELVNSMRYQTGKPVVVHIDECHETSEQKRRGELVERLVANGALVVLYTATAIRADGETIPGFTYRVLDTNNVKRFVTTDTGDGVHNRVDVYEGERRVLEILANHTTTFQEAWDEDPSPLCDLSREVIQVYLNDLAADEERIRLSDCAPSRARQYLAKAVRHPLVIREGIDLFVRELDLRQRVNPDAAGLVFSCSDSPGESNQHAREIAAVIAEVKPDYQCCIVTMKSLEGDETSTKQIERFVGVDGGQGKGDVLIVKQMGGAGLDPPRVKVLLDLSPVRTVASVIQRLMRVATPWAGIKTASVITLADPLMDAIWQRYVVEEGGEAMSSTSDVDMDFVRSYLVEKGGEGPEPLLAIVSAEICAFDNNFGQVGELTNLGLVNALIGRVPSLTNWHTKAELSDMLAGFVVPPEAVKPVPALRTTIENKQAAINARVKDLAQRESPYNPTNTGPFIERCKYWMNGAKRAAGVSLAVKLDDIVNTTTLDVMLNFLAK